MGRRTVTTLVLSLCALTAAASARAQVTSGRANFTKALGAFAVGEVHRHLADVYAALGRLDESREERAAYDQLRRDDLRQSAGRR